MLNWQYSGIENVAKALVTIQGYGSAESWAASIKATAERAYGDGGVGYVETAGYCVTIWADDNGTRHAKVTLSAYGVLLALGINP